MKLLYISHHRRFKTFARSGLFARLMAKAGHEVTLLCIADTARWQNRETLDDGVRYWEAADLLPGQLRSGWDPVSMVRRSRWINAEPFDLIHLFETRPATIYPALHYLRRRHVPLVMDWNDWWGRGGLIRELRPRWYQLLFEGFETYFEEHFRIQAQVTTVISHALGDRAVDLGVPAETIHWIPGIADTLRFSPMDRWDARRRFGLPEDRLLMGFSAMDVVHDAELVFATTALVAKEQPKAMLVMTGRETPGFKDMATRHGVQDHFRHLGLLPYEELPAALAAIDIFLLPFSRKTSNIGRWPNKVGDYLATGRPVVTNPVGEMETLFAGGAGGLLVEETPDAMAAGVFHLLAEPERMRRMGLEARGMAERELTADTMQKRILDAYKSLM